MIIKFNANNIRFIKKNKSINCTFTACPKSTICKSSLSISLSTWWRVFSRLIYIAYGRKRLYYINICCHS